VRIATKVGAEPREPGSWPDRRQGLSASAVRKAFAGSLDRLGLDRVDLLWVHQEDRSAPIEETVGALAELTAAGAVDRVGASNHPAWRVERARAHALSIGARPFDAFQLNTTYLRPRPGTLPPGVAHRFGVLSDEQRHYAAEHDIEVWAYTPLLSGAYDNPDKQIPEVYDHPGNAARLAALDAVAAETGAARGQVVLAWLHAQGIRPMLGGSRVDQLDSALDAMELRLTGAQRERLDAVDRAEWASPYPVR
jgi:aryl-alcohol dehydrogenase-like predicted oxidoreductase